MLKIQYSHVLRIGGKRRVVVITDVAESVSKRGVAVLTNNRGTVKRATVLGVHVANVEAEVVPVKAKPQSWQSAYNWGDDLMMTGK